MYTYAGGDDIMDFAFKLRCTVFDEWLNGQHNVKALCKKYGFSRKWFYKYKERFLQSGFDGLKDKIRRKPTMLHALALDEKIAIMDYIYNNPTHGPKRISMELKMNSNSISEGAIYNFLSRENLNTKLKRILWAESQGKKILTNKQKAYLNAQHRHIESNRPGELVSVDTFWLNIKNFRRIYQYTACDTFSSYGWAKVYHSKTADETIDFLENHILKNVPRGKIKRILTDQGTEFYSARHKRHLTWLEDTYKEYNLKHSVTKIAHPWTNGYAERLNRTIWDEFYLCRLSEEFDSLSAIQKELDIFMREYNFRRVHTGYKLKEQGYLYPYQAFFDIKEAKKIVPIEY